MMCLLAPGFYYFLLRYSSHYCTNEITPLLLLNFIVLFLLFFNFIFRLGRWHISKETLSHMQTLKYLINLLQLVMNWPRLLSVSEVFENHV